MDKKEKRCPYCDNIIKGHPNKRFCNQKHKDKYHNFHNPRGYYKDVEFFGRENIEDTMHPQDPYSLGQD